MTNRGLDYRFNPQMWRWCWWWLACVSSDHNNTTLPPVWTRDCASANIPLLQDAFAGWKELEALGGYMNLEVSRSNTSITPHTNTHTHTERNRWNGGPCTSTQTRQPPIRMHTNGPRSAPWRGRYWDGWMEKPVDRPGVCAPKSCCNRLQHMLFAVSGCLSVDYRGRSMLSMCLYAANLVAPFRCASGVHLRQWGKLLIITATGTRWRKIDRNY